MDFNSAFLGALPSPAAEFRQTQAMPFPRPNTSCDSDSEVTVLRSLDHPVNKRFYIGSDGKVQKQNFQNAFHFDVVTVPVAGITDLARLIDFYSKDDRHFVIRGLPVVAVAHKIRKTGENFAEHPEGTPWVMLDIDNISVPENIDPLSTDAIEYAIQKFPAEFHNASYFYQHSGSAGILGNDGAPMKSGLNVHLFFWLSRRVSGKSLTAYLSLHCMETGFYTLDANRGGVVELRLGIDPAPIRSEVQAHYIATPTIEPGVSCRVTAENRQGLIEKGSDSVVIPPFSGDLKDRANKFKNRLVNDYKRSHGYVTRVVQTNDEGKIATTRYSVAPGQGARGGRPFTSGELSVDGKYFTLFFADEETPGSWYVSRSQAQMAVRHGDHAIMPLNELSQGAHEYVRDTLRWFSEIPHHDLALVNGYVPPLASFARAKISLVLSPTGSGKTIAAIRWTQERIAQGQLVIYAAPTIPLVKQMRNDLAEAGLAPGYYGDLKGITNLPETGVIVTTNNSLPRFLEYAYDRGIPHVLIFDEIHQGMDWFLGSSSHQRNLEGALSKARQSLLLTGTLTDVQRHAIVDIAKHALGSQTEDDYCRYEFAPIKRNPLFLLPTKRFDSDLITLFESFQAKLRNNEPIPRFVMLLDTSKMDVYRTLVASYGLEEHAEIVSRPENSPEEIEQARTSARPMLISSPLFGLGLNFLHEPAMLWCRFDHVNADMSQIVQAVNRANRGQVQCEVRIYGNVSPDAEFMLPDKVKLKAQITERFQQEASFAGLLEEHFQLDRVTYQALRDVERDSYIALSVLVRENAIQNFTVVSAPDLPEVSNEKAKVFKAARKEAREGYGQAIIAESERFSNCGPTLGLIKLERLYQERNENWRNTDRRLERDMKDEEAGIIMAMCGISEPAAALKVKVAKVMRLFGEISPWTSSQYDREQYPDWAKVEAEKTDKLIVLLQKFQALKAGQITWDELSASLTRNGQMTGAFQALESNDLKFQTVAQKIEALKKRREEVRTKGGDRARAEVQEQGFELLLELLQPLGIPYGKKFSTGKWVTDNTKPIVPTPWNLPEMILNLERQAVRLRALPSNQKEPIVAAPTEDFMLSFGEAMHRDICEPCKFFHQNACALGRPMDWQSYGRADPLLKCGGCEAIKPHLILH